MLLEILLLYYCQKYTNYLSGNGLYVKATLLKMDDFLQQLSPSSISILNSKSDLFGGDCLNFLYVYSTNQGGISSSYLFLFLVFVVFGYLWLPSDICLVLVYYLLYYKRIGRMNFAMYRNYITIFASTSPFKYSLHGVFSFSFFLLGGGGVRRLCHCIFWITYTN